MRRSRSALVLVLPSFLLAAAAVGYRVTRPEPPSPQPPAARLLVRPSHEIPDDRTAVEGGDGPALLSRLRTPSSPSPRTAAAEAFGTLIVRDPFANAALIPELLRLVSADPDPEVRSILANHVGLPSLRPQASAILPSLREALGEEKEPAVRRSLSVAIRRLE